GSSARGCLATLAFSLPRSTPDLPFSFSNLPYRQGVVRRTHCPCRHGGPSYLLRGRDDLSTVRFLASPLAPPDPFYTGLVHLLGRGWRCSFDTTQSPGHYSVRHGHLFPDLIAASSSFLAGRWCYR